MPRPLIKPSLLLIALAVMWSATSHGQIYKWTDADGNLHFSDQPPPADAQDSNEVTLADDQPSAEESAESRRQTQQLRSSNRTLNQNRAQRESVRSEQRQAQQQRERQCATARAQLAVVQRTNRTYRPGPDGERVFMDEAAREARTERIEQAVARFCD